MVNYPFNKYTMDQAIALYDTAMLQFMQSDNKTVQYANELVAKSCKAADVHDGKILIDVFTKIFHALVCDSLSHYLTQKLQVESCDIALQVEPLFRFQKDAGNVSNNNKSKYNSYKPFSKTPWNSSNTANVISTETTTSTTRN